MDVKDLIEAGRLAIETAEGLMAAIDKAKTALADSTANLKALVSAAEKEAEKGDQQLARDRKEADDAFDKKFDQGGKP